MICCVDCAVVCGNEVLLGTRLDDPAEGVWWIMGGRMKIGEDPRQTAQRVLQRELDIDVVDIRAIVDLNLAISYVWRARSQPPQNHGCHMVGHYYFTQVDESEKDCVCNQ